MTAVIDDGDEALQTHLAAWLGAWPPPGHGLTVVASPRRDLPGWDGQIRPMIGVVTPAGGVLSVPPAHAEAAARAVSDGPSPGVDDFGGELAAALGNPGGRVVEGVFRWTVRPTEMPDAGEWRPVDDPVVPAWLEPFGGEVLVALEDGRYIAGVGLKRHDPTGQEVAVVTEPQARGRGLARRLVSQAARRVVSGGAVVTYLHAPSNTASARVAEACGFPDRGWKVLFLSPG